LENKYFEKIKKSKVFELGDILVYACLFVLIISLFLGFVVFPKSQEKNQFFITIGNKTVLSYDFSNRNLIIEQDFLSNVEHSTDGDYINVKIYTNNEKTEHNSLLIDLNKKTVKITDGTCPSKKCLLSGYCEPHDLKIVSGYVPPVVG